MELLPPEAIDISAFDPAVPCCDQFVRFFLSERTEGEDIIRHSFPHICRSKRRIAQKHRGGSKKMTPISFRLSTCFVAVFGFEAYFLVLLASVLRYVVAAAASRQM